MTGAEREAACARMIPLVATIARGLMRVYRCGEYADAFQDGCVGLLRAVSTFDPARGVPLEIYARKVIAGAILNGIRVRDPVSEHARGLIREAERDAQVRACAGEPDGPASLAAMGKRLSALGAALLMAHRARTMSLDEPLPRGESLAPNWDDDPARIVEQRENTRRLQAALAALTDRQRAVIGSYYFSDKNVETVGEELAISKQRVSQLHHRALERMRETLVTP